MTQITHPTPRRIGWIAPALALAAAVAIAAAAYGLTRSSTQTRSSAPAPVHRVSLPAGWHATPATLGSLITVQLGARSDVPRYAGSDGLARLRAARCTPAGICALSYNVDYTPAFHTLGQMTAQLGPVLAAAFTDTRLRGLSITGWGPSAANGVVQQNPVLQLDCSRSQVGGVDLARASAAQLQSACAFVPYARP
jgi:hypothetical protein